MHLRLVAIAGSFFVVLSTIHADPIKVRYPEGSVHGYLALKSLDGKLLAAGDLIQTIRGGQLSSRLIYRFRDGSVDDETAVFTQRDRFRLVSDHRVQKGPTFPRATDVMIDGLSGEVTVRYTADGEEKVDTSHVDLPEDLANGFLLNVVKNISPRAAKVQLSYLVAAPKPRIIRLTFTQDGTETFRSAGEANRAQRYRVHAEIGGLMGLLAPILGKEPPDSYIWVSMGKVPAFIRSETPLYLGGPQLLTQQISPVWDGTAGRVR